VRRAAALLALVAVCVLPAAAAAKDCPKTSLGDIEDEVMCPVCGVPLGLAEAPQAERERAFIRGMIDRCRSKQEIKRALAAELGPSVLALPEDEGFNVAAYLVPALAILAASLGLALGLVTRQRERRRSGSDHPALGDTPPLDPADLARVDAELESRKR
jgi:cytochrome c-type biogenesis protein CcmH/NrfF